MALDRPSTGRRERVLGWLLVALWLLNLEDYVLTQIALRSGATESNGLMAYFLRLGVLPSLLFKLGVVTGGAALLWRLRRYPVVMVATVTLVIAYVAVVGWDISGLS